jgi:hypothetical protein
MLSYSLRGRFGLESSFLLSRCPKSPHLNAGFGNSILVSFDFVCLTAFAVLRSLKWDFRSSSTPLLFRL